MNSLIPHFAFPNFAMLTLLLAAACSTLAAEYSCSVSKKVDHEREFTAGQIKLWQFSNRIEEVGDKVWVSRCSLAPSAGKVKCERYQMDRVDVDPYVKIKKFYMFGPQFDLQLYPDLSYIENNGRGSVSFGRCTLVTP